MKTRNLILVLGDQLDRGSSAFDHFSKSKDTVWMAEVVEESTHVWNHKARIAMFLAAMRHFAAELKKSKFRVDYHELGSPHTDSFSTSLKDALDRLKPEQLIVVHPGEYRVRESLLAVSESSGIPLEIREDRHFFSTPEEFAAHAKGRKQLRLEFFYREMRRRHEVLMQDDQPVGGQWNYDAENRGAFGKQGPGDIPKPRSFPPDKVTRNVLNLVADRFCDHPGSLDHFDWPVTSTDAAVALDDFITHRLPEFGNYQDAMWTDEPFLLHSRLSAALNLKLLDPRIVVAKAVEALHSKKAPLASVEGFVRQILGWREYIRGIYWTLMPEYSERNALAAKAKLPEFYWTADTDMHCLRQAIQQTLDYGYAHHIQRLMVTGLFALLLGVHPQAVHKWYLAMYIDAVEWVELPNTLGMAMFADGGVMASKPYAATGKYIQRMSNYCSSCCYDPAKATGDDACPFTTLYWDFLMRHQKTLAANPRMSLQVRNLERKSKKERDAIREQAARLKSSLSG